MTYPESIHYLESFINYEKKADLPYARSLRLERIRDFLRLIGDPQDELRCLHVAGTKGKGSVCAFCAYILRAAGYKAGLYTSPHLSDFRERIRILGRPSSVYPEQRRGAVRLSSKEDFEGMIPKKALARIVQNLKPRIEQYNKNSKYGALTFFEVYTSIAFIHFVQQKVDFAVLETGLGGRLDATNVADPLVAAIAPISLEHTRILGNSLRKIAVEKSGIIKSQKSKLKSQKTIAVSAPQKKEAERVIRKRCEDVGVELRRVDKDKFLKKYPGLKLRLAGAHQVINAATAEEVIDSLKEFGFDIRESRVRKGLIETRWPGRCEVVARRPLVILDGAQNAASAEAVRRTIRDYNYRKMVLILGISSDKDIKGICRMICPMADKIILTAADNPRAAAPGRIERTIRGFMPRLANRVIVTGNTRQAAQAARLAAAKEDLVLGAGSLFVVGELRNEFHKDQ